jgi:hypothetical protein
MKCRTRIAAWVGIVMWSIVSVACLVLGLSPTLLNSKWAILSVFLFIACVISISLLVGWIQLLRKKNNAWLVLVIAHVLLLLGSIMYSISSGVTYNGTSSNTVMILYMGVLFLSFLALLTDSPMAWQNGIDE